MALSAHPFHPTTGELLPGYRDAYLRGDLSNKNTELVDAYLKANPAKSEETYYRFHTLQGNGHAVRPVGWVRQQLTQIQTEPARFRQRAGGLLVVAALLSGAVFAAKHPAASASPELAGATVSSVPYSELAANEAASASTFKMTTVVGRILDEDGHPLVGATVLDKKSGRGVSTGADGKYSLVIPDNQALNLQFGYGGYSEEEVQVKGRSVQNVTLLPRTDQQPKRRWWLF
ncbi:MAG: hypothetical protein EOO56_14510 [Hymenobacter sp.]|nr:MAG: hypothetical protein EOO56_14510 [Hymenobacter sp.]